jgi:hypothetical protein
VQPTAGLVPSALAADGRRQIPPMLAAPEVVARVDDNLNGMFMFRFTSTSTSM